MRGPAAQSRLPFRVEAGGWLGLGLLAFTALMYGLRKIAMLVLKQGVRPIESERVAYFLDPALAGLWDDPR